MPTHQVLLTVTNGSFNQSTSHTLTPPAEVSASETVVTATTDGLIDVDWPYANMTSFYLKSDQDVLVETNSGSSPINTFTLLANVPVVWYTGAGYTNPITANVTGLFVTNVSGETANIDLLVGYNSSP